jgi:putative copper export protein
MRNPLSQRHHSLNGKSSPNPQLKEVSYVVLIVQGTVLFLHFFEYQQTKMMSEMRDTDYGSCMRLIRFILMVLYVVVSVAVFYVVYNMQQNPEESHIWVQVAIAIGLGD